ncbi:lysophospholipid acyltransferase family protein [Erysipelotrichaceae bacterium 66-17]
MKQTIEFDTYSDDVVKAPVQDKKLPASYRWEHHSALYDTVSHMLYKPFYGWACLYIRHILHTTIVNKQLLDKEKRGFFLYINHTQVIGDPFLASQLVTKKRAYVIASPSNLSVPLIGRLLPMLGALPVPDNLDQMRMFRKAIEEHIGQGDCIVVFPEAHVWPYYTKLRPFQNGAFQFPVDTNAPAYCAVVTYQENKHRTVYIDGPFEPDSTLPRIKKRKKLAEEVFERMNELTAHNTVEYVQYIQRKESL